MRVLLERLEKKTRTFDRQVVLRDLRESLAGALVTVLFLWFAFHAANPVSRLAYLWLAACGVWIIVFLLRYAKVARKPAPEQTLTGYQGALVEKIDRQIRLLKNVKYWYILPLWLGQMLVAVAFLGRPGGWIGFSCLAVFVTAVNGAIWWLNESQGVGWLRRQREELLALTLKIIALLVLLVSASTGLWAGERKTAMDGIVQPVMESGAVAGVVIGIQEGSRTEFYGYGRLNTKRAGTPNQAMVFEIGSVTKVFTSLVLADMAEHGQVVLEDPVRKYLPEGTVPLPEAGSPEIRLIDLATHTSGLPRMPSNFKPANPANPYADYTPGKLYEFLAKQTLLRKPDARYLYSNLGAGLLGHVLACRAGLSYEQMVVQRISKPLGLRDTVVTLSEDQKSRLLEGHDADGEPASSWDMDALSGAGALRSTAADLLRFAAANLQPPAELAASIVASHRIRAKIDQPPGSIALAWHVQPDGTTYWHNGGTGGYGAYVSFHTARQTAVVVLMNTTGGRGLQDQIGTRMEKLLAGQAVEPIKVRQPVQIDPKALDACTGKYQMSGIPFTIRREGNRLIAEQAGQAPVRIYPESETKFFARTLNAEVTFTRSESGQMTGLVLAINGVKLPAKRLP
jgi:CubicO group peptidase (beta-lactamase class C family)